MGVGLLQPIKVLNRTKRSASLSKREFSSRMLFNFVCTIISPGLCLLAVTLGLHYWLNHGWPSPHVTSADRQEQGVIWATKPESWCAQIHSIIEWKWRTWDWAEQALEIWVSYVSKHPNAHAARCCSASFSLPACTHSLMGEIPVIRWQGSETLSLVYSWLCTIFRLSLKVDGCRALPFWDILEG